MGRTAIVPENRVSQDIERFAALRLAQVNERARIACLERQQLPDGRNVLTPWMEFVHRIEGVQEENGVPMQKKITRKDKSGQETTEMVWATSWIGSPICLGDKAILLEKGLDPDNCPVCRASQEHPEITAHRGFGAPVVRYAMNVVRFSTRPGGFILAEPFGAQILVWSFTEKRFNRLDDLNRKLAERGELQYRKADGSTGVRPYDITDVDLLLGPCEDTAWQRFEIDVAEGLAMWRRSQATVQYVQQLWLGAGMRATDEQLQLACGRPVTNRGYLDSDIAKAVGSWNKALRGGPGTTVDPFGAGFGGQQGQQDMQAGMNGMLSTMAPPLPAPPQAGYVPQPPDMGVPQVPQPTVQPLQPPAPPQVPQVPQPTVQPTPPGPPQPAQEMPPAPPTQAQMDAMAGGHGLDQFASPVPPPPPTALAQAAAPDLAAMQAQQMQQFQAAGVPGVAQAMVPPPPPPAPAAPAYAPAAPAPVPGATTTTPGPVPSAPASAPQQPAQPMGAADLFAPPAAPGPAPAGAAQEFSDLANF